MSGQTQPELIPLPPADPDRQQHTERRAAIHAHTGTPTPMNSGWHEHLRKPVQDAIEAWASTEAAS